MGVEIYLALASFLTFIFFLVALYKSRLQTREAGKKLKSLGLLSCPFIRRVFNRRGGSGQISKTLQAGV